MLTVPYQGVTAAGFIPLQSLNFYQLEVLQAKRNISPLLTK